MKRKIKVYLDFTKLFDGLIVSKSPKVLETEFEIEETPENYKILCSSELIKSWNFVEDSMKMSVDNYSEVKKEFDSLGINTKDLRDIIMISYSYYCISEMKNVEPDIKDVTEYYLVNKDSIKNKVYSEELILVTLSALSETSNPLLDFLERLENIKCKDYITFEEFYKKLYEHKK